MRINKDSTVLTMKILITGFAGFIGFHAAQAFLRRGWHVVGVDNFCDYYNVALKRDRAKTNVLQISELGLLEMSRQRHDQSILSRLTSKCPCCSGHGFIKSPMAISVEIQRKLVSLLRKAAAEKKPFEPKIVIAPQVMQRLRTEDATVLAELQKEYDTRLTFVSELHRPPESFSILDASDSRILYSQQ